MSGWKIYDPDSELRSHKAELPAPPPWRQSGERREAVLAATFRPNDELVDAVNTAIYLRRPLLVTGKPGTGKSSLIYSVAKQLALGPVLVWAINSRSTLQEGLYQYDALARLQHTQQLQARAASEPKLTSSTPKGVSSKLDGWDDSIELGLFVSLGPLGSALASVNAPRALLIDEIDKSDVDLPNDLLNILETGQFVIPELRRAAKQQPLAVIPAQDGEQIPVKQGEVTYSEYPFIVMTSNGERDFPAPFLRRCVQCQIPEPDEQDLLIILKAHFGERGVLASSLISKFLKQRTTLQLATDQLLNAMHVVNDAGLEFSQVDEERLLKTLFQSLG
jgi:MoxR-like ATPase